MQTPLVNPLVFKMHLVCTLLNKHKLFCPVGLGTSPGLSRGQARLVPGNKPGENLGQTQVFSLFYTVEARRFAGLGQTRGRRASQIVYVKKVYVPLSLATPGLKNQKLKKSENQKCRHFLIFRCQYLPGIRLRKNNIPVLGFYASGKHEFSNRGTNSEKPIFRLRASSISDAPKFPSFRGHRGGKAPKHWDPRYMLGPKL